MSVILTDQVLDSQPRARTSRSRRASCPPDQVPPAVLAAGPGRRWPTRSGSTYMVALVLIVLCIVPALFLPRKQIETAPDEQDLIGGTGRHALTARTPAPGSVTAWRSSISPSTSSGATAARACRPTASPRSGRDPRARRPRRGRSTSVRVATPLRQVTTYDVTFSGFGGHPVRGWLDVPAAPPGRCPASSSSSGTAAGAACRTTGCTGRRRVRPPGDGHPGTGQRRRGGDTPDPAPAAPARPPPAS